MVARALVSKGQGSPVFNILCVLGGTGRRSQRQGKRQGQAIAMVWGCPGTNRDGPGRNLALAIALLYR